MRSSEFITRQSEINRISRRPNIVGRVDVGDYVMFIDIHLLDQTASREVDKFVIEKVIPKIPKAKAKIKTLATSQSFWLYDNTNKISLGVKILNQEHKIFLVKTVWDGMPGSDKNYPIFNVA